MVDKQGSCELGWLVGALRIVLHPALVPGSSQSGKFHLL